MVEDPSKDPTGYYSRFWDSYVKRDFPTIQGRHGEVQWPGDEWGTPATWEETFSQLFQPAQVSAWKRAVEIGPGSGKYTLMVLERSQASIQAFDVSREFMSTCEKRCEGPIREGRLTLCHLPEQRPDELHAALSSSNWSGTVDAFYSIDALVHVDLQFMIVYLLTAALCLRKGGWLILTCADPTTPNGFQKLLNDIRLVYPARPQPTSKFEWINRELMASVLTNLGFDVVRSFDNGRDLHLLATLAEPERARGMERFL